MSNWGENEKKQWENSEVLREFEKQSLQRALKLAEHVSQLEKSAAPVAQTLKDVAQSATKAKDSIVGMKKELLNLSDDEASTVEGGEEDSEEKDIQKLVSELQVVAKEAIESGNIKLAYKIERTIDEILGR